MIIAAEWALTAFQKNRQGVPVQQLGDPKNRRIVLAVTSSFGPPQYTDDAGDGECHEGDQLEP